jgi:hypothetical protein
MVETAGWGVACLFAVGLVDAVARRRWSLLATIQLPALALAAFMGGQLSFFERNLSHGVPLYLLGAGMGLNALVETDRLRRWAGPVFLALAGAAALVPAAISWRMVFSGFSGRFESARAPEVAGFLAGPGLPAVARDHVIVAASDTDPWFKGGWEASPGPYVILWSDVDPDYTRECLGRLRTRFRIEERAVLPGLFDDLRGPNSLRDYLCRTLRAYVFYGLRASQPGAGPAPAGPGKP